eukprot:408868-Pyramimonas_sp.AAC.1
MRAASLALKTSWGSLSVKSRVAGGAVAGGARRRGRAGRLFFPASRASRISVTTKTARPLGPKRAELLVRAGAGGRAGSAGPRT